MQAKNIKFKANYVSAEKSLYYKKVVQGFLFVFLSASASIIHGNNLGDCKMNNFHIFLKIMEETGKVQLFFSCLMTYTIYSNFEFTQ